MKDWNKKFTAPYTDSELESLRQLSLTVDELWENQIKLRQTVEEETQDALAIFGKEDAGEDSHTTIRQKDLIYSKLYKSEHMKNAGPYARLKFAMDYWCALWFWPIDQAELLPTRSEFFNDLNLILVGTFSTKGNSNMLQYQQLSLFPTEQEEIVSRINELFPGQSEVDIDNLCALFPRLALVRQIAEQNHFMHWELEFADLFAEKGGFDLVIGNPPWIKVVWNEQSVLSDVRPILAVKNLTATQVAKERKEVLLSKNVSELYFREYIVTAGQQSYLGASVNYPELSGSTNLYKCFLPQAWKYGSSEGVSAFVHPDGVYDDPKGGDFREVLYGKLRKHFQFENELNLFEGTNDHGRMRFSLNVYCNKKTSSFDIICNLFTPSTIDDCYESDDVEDIPGIKDENGNWNTNGHKKRIIHIGQREMSMFSVLFDGCENWKQARLPIIHAQPIIDVLMRFAEQTKTVASYGDHVYTSNMWHETNSQQDGTIVRNVHFPVEGWDLIYSGSHIGLANPLFKASREKCVFNGDFDLIDLTTIPANYMQRCNYMPACSIEEFNNRIPTTPWGTKITNEYRLMNREMLNLSGERTTFPSVIAPKCTNVNTIFEVAFKEWKNTALLCGLEASLPYDFLVKTIGKGHLNYNTTMLFPVPESIYNSAIIYRSLRLNCVSEQYRDLWEKCWDDTFFDEEWTKHDNRLEPFSRVEKTWTWLTPLRTDYERRQALIELDVLVAMSLNLTLDELISIYHIQFPVLQQNEADTWYDVSGRIVFTTNKGLTNIGFSRNEWENNIKNLPDGCKAHRTFDDNTLPGGLIKRSIEYVAPFDRCDREQDYETAWKFFEDKYGKKE